MGSEADLANNYMARISSVFGLRHIKVICSTSNDDVSAGSSFFQDDAGALDLVGSSQAPDCAIQLRRAVLGAVQDHGLGGSLEERRRMFLRRRLEDLSRVASRGSHGLFEETVRPSAADLVELLGKVNA